MKKKYSKTQQMIEAIPGLFERDWKSETSSVIKKVMRKKRFYKITLVGTGSSYHVALWASWMFREETNLVVEVLTTWDYLATHRLPQEGELTCLVTHRGKKNLSELFLDRIAKSDHILFCAKGSPTGKHPTIFTSDPEESNSHTISLIAAICGLSELCCAFLENKDAAFLRLERNRLGQIFNELMKDVLDLGFQMTLDSEQKNGVSYYIGAGVFEAIAKECALKAREMAGLSAQSYGLEDVLHGPLNGFSKKDTVYLLPSLTSPKTENEKFLYLERMKRLVQLLEKIDCRITVPRFTRKTLNHAVSLKPYFQSLIYLNWSQWTNLGFAYQMSKNPDENCFL